MNDILTANVGAAWMVMCSTVQGFAHRVDKAKEPFIFSKFKIKVQGTGAGLLCCTTQSIM